MINLKKLCFNYKNLNSKIDKQHESHMHFDLKIEAGQRVAITGASGAGKSTLLNLIAGFNFANSGELFLNNENHTLTQPYQRPISILFQQNNLFEHLSVRDNIILGIQPKLKVTPQQRQQVEAISEQVQLNELLNRLPHQLSGGQRQRVALARCMLREQPILLLDEPFSALDPELRESMLGLFDEICLNKNLTLLMVTHQLSEVSIFIDSHIEISNGTIVH